MRLHDWISGLKSARLVCGDGSLWIKDITDDSRRVQPGWAFVARRGTREDGAGFIVDAIRRGAVAILSEQDPIQPASSVTSTEADVSVAWVRLASLDPPTMSQLAQRFFGYPTQKLRLIGITGTNGKTTTAYLIQHVLNHVGYRCGLISTVEVDNGLTRTPAGMTTPGAIELARHLSDIAAHGCQAAVAEVSSHALHQGRTSGLEFAVAVFTNLTGDHLDYHQTMEAYANAKASLFTDLPSHAWAVINTDDPYATRMTQDCRAKVLKTRLKSANERASYNPALTSCCPHHLASSDVVDAHACAAEILDLRLDRSRVRLDGPWGSVEVRLPLVGRHNVCNALQAVAAANALTATEYGLHRALESCPAVPGRLERVREHKSPQHAPQAGPAVFVDYAHTHDALENTLGAIHPLIDGRLVVVFGCGGDRDRDKRPKMAAAACQWAHRVIITSDNPRTENPTTIIDEILTGVPATTESQVMVNPDRAKAIAKAIMDADEHDTILIAGKGHEDYQVIGNDKLPFDDRFYAAQALSQRDHHPA